MWEKGYRIPLNMPQCMWEKGYRIPLNMHNVCEKGGSEHVPKCMWEKGYRIPLNMPQCMWEKPYWNRELSSLKSRKVNSYRAWVSAKRPRERDNPLYIQYTHDKNLFHKTIKKLAKSYEDAEIRKIVKTAEVSRNSFWKMISTARNSKSSGVSAIKRTDKVVVHEMDQVLMVWAEHFKKIGTPKEATNYDQRHFDFVTDFVARHNDANDLDQFLTEPFTMEEVHKGIKTLHLGKAPGFDNVMTEHLLYAGPMVVYLLCDLYNGICTREYIPLCFKRGIQVPLYKGKDTCVLDPNNYRGITLLSIFNKLFEVLLWQRLKPWWVENRVISELQGACRGGASCLHTAFNLKETVATSMENYDKCFVSFFDVAKRQYGSFVSSLLALFNLTCLCCVWSLFVDRLDCVQTSWFVVHSLQGININQSETVVSYDVVTALILLTLLSPTQRRWTRLQYITIQGLVLLFPGRFAG